MDVFLGIALPVATAIILHGLIGIYLEPAIKTRQTMGEIDFALFFYADIYSNPPPKDLIPERRKRMEEASTELRLLASRLRAQANGIPLYVPASFLCRLPSRNDIDTASRDLIGLSNSIFTPFDPAENTARRNQIQRLLALNVW